MLKDYEEEILLQLYDNGLIAMKYCSTQKAADIIKWQEIAKKYDIQKKLFRMFSENLRQRATWIYTEKAGMLFLFRVWASTTSKGTFQNSRTTMCRSFKICFHHPKGKTRFSDSLLYSISRKEFMDDLKTS